MKKTNIKIGLVLLAYIAFISLGLPDGLLGVGWPSIRASFSLSIDSLGVLLFASMAGYLTSSFFSGRLLARMGISRLLAASCAATGAALLGYTLVPSWWMLVLLGVVSGLGAGAIDAGLNTYIAANFGAGMMQWLHASYGVGVTLGPIIMTASLKFLYTWRMGYVIVLAACFVLTLPIWMQKQNDNEPEQDQRLTDYKTPLSETLRQPLVWISIVLFLLYAGAEVSLGAWAYTLLTESRGIAPETAGLWAGSYWGTFTIGRLLAGLYTRRIGVNTLILGSLLAALSGVVLLWWNPSDAASLVGVVLTGFAIAPIFPGLVSGTSRRVGVRFAANTIGMQMGAAGFGAAMIPGLVGVLAERISLEMIPFSLFVLFVLLLVLYIFFVQLKPQHTADSEKNIEKAGGD